MSTAPSWCQLRQPTRVLEYIRCMPKRLEDSHTPEITVRRGASMMDFTGTRKLHRRAGERISEFSIRFDEGVNNLKDDIDINVLMPHPRVILPANGDAHDRAPRTP